jgi:Bacterial transcriptional activator domain
VLAGSGRKADALKHYEHVVALLKGELDVEPDTATKVLAANLRKPERPSPTTKASTNLLETYRFKDFCGSQKTAVTWGCVRAFQQVGSTSMNGLKMTLAPFTKSGCVA